MASASAFAMLTLTGARAAYDNRTGMPSKSKTWSLFAGIVIICLSLWALHRFCDGYSMSTLTRPVTPGFVTAEPPVSLSAESVCAKRLGAVTMVGGLGVACLLGAWLLQRLSESRGLRRLSTGLAVIGRLIALGSLGMVALVLVFSNQF